MSNLSRRNFLVGCSSAVAAMAGARFNSVVFGNPADEPNQEILLQIFLRGGIDSLNMLPPIGGADRGHYETARPTLAVPTGAALQLGTTQFGLHPSAAPLKDLYDNGNLAIIQAAGQHHETRSHFDAMSYMELGVPGSISTPTGWITRHLDSTTAMPEELVMPAMAVGYFSPQAFQGSAEVIAMNNPARLNLNSGPWLWRNQQRTTMRRMYETNATGLHDATMQAMDASDILTLNNVGTYTPSGGVVYPDSAFGEHLQIVAQMIKLQLGLRTASVDIGGWDTHENQGDGAGGYFGDLLGELAGGMAAFYEDLDAAGSNYTGRLTVVVMSEFGRRIEENGDDGTDHGHGCMMMVMGGNVNGGMHGTWPGLAPAALYEGIDLEVTTDYRRVLSEILIRRLCNPNLGEVFPGYTGYSPLGVVQGQDLVPVYDGVVPAAVELVSADTNTPSTQAGKAATAAGLSLAATAGLVALRNRGASE